MHVAFNSYWRNTGTVCLSEDFFSIFLGGSCLLLEAEEVKINDKETGKKWNSLHN